MKRYVSNVKISPKNGREVEITSFRTRVYGMLPSLSSFCALSFLIIPIICQQSWSLEIGNMVRSILIITLY